MGFGMSSTHVGEKDLATPSGIPFDRWLTGCAHGGVRYDVGESDNSMVISKENKTSHCTIDVVELAGLPKHTQTTVAITPEADDK